MHVRRPKGVAYTAAGALASEVLNLGENRRAGSKPPAVLFRAVSLRLQAVSHHALLVRVLMPVMAMMSSSHITVLDHIYT